MKVLGQARWPCWESAVCRALWPECDPQAGENGFQQGALISMRALPHIPPTHSHTEE